MAANGITDAERKKSVFLSVIGPKTYKLLASLVAPAKPGDKTYGELVELLSDHHNPPPSEIVQRYKFHTKVRGPGESIATFVAELRALGQTCGFGDSLEDMLRDRLVCGVNDDRIQRRLLSETERRLDFKRALEIALGAETADKNARELQSQRSAAARHPPKGQTDVCAVAVVKCYRCGKPNHKPAQCRFKTARCHNCGKVGHLRAVCRADKKANKPPANPTNQQPREVRTVNEGTVDFDKRSLVLNQVVGKSGKPFMLDVVLDGRPLQMELDTGAVVSLVSEKTYQTLFPDTPMQTSTVSLKTYSGEPLKVVGQREVEVYAERQTVRLPLIVVAGEGPSLFGRDWLQAIQIDWRAIKQVRQHQLSDVLDKYKAVFQPGLGTLEGYKAQILVDPKSQPRFCKARSVPYALRSKVEEELQRLQKEGVIEPIQFADWAAPIVPVLKQDGKSVRICGDFKMTVNQASKLDRYPIPKIEDLFSKLAGGQLFSKLDMSQAYQQILLEEDSQKYVVVNTHQGLFKYKRLPFGVASAPGIFQRVMEGLLSGIPGVTVYLDDILVTGKTEAAHLSALEEVLKRMSEAGLRLREDKCTFLTTDVVYLGHRIDAQGLHPVAEKVRAVQNAPTPKNIMELRSFLGLLSYYSRFLPNLSTLLAPLSKLLKQNQPWIWGPKQVKAFEESKKLLLSSQLLVHFDPDLDIVLACDASAYGIGGVLSHRMPDGTEKPIGFVSRTLTETEKNYSQIEKEALSCVFGIQRFHSYLYGHHFVLQTDHKPLLTLFNERKCVPPQASGQIQRWALKLAAYEYTIAGRSTTQHANADAMSRLPLADVAVPVIPQTIPELVLMVEHLQDAPITARQIAQWTSRDPLLSKVCRYILEGWPDKPDTDELKPYWSRKLELSLHEGCILWGGRVVIPPKGRDFILMELHGGHPGVSRMKALARNIVWWPGLDAMVENMIKNCSECQQVEPLPASEPLQLWSWPSRPWTRLHIDYAGPMDGRMFLVVVDSHSKWLEVIPMKTATAKTTVQRLRTLFSKFGVPESIVSDNGPQFAAAEFQDFCKLNGIRHMLIAPYHPASNGLAERGVQTFKRGYQKLSEGTVEDRIARFLLQYRITPHSTTGRSPAELLFGRKLRTRLDLVKPDLSKTVECKQLNQKMLYDKKAKVRVLGIGDRVYVKNFGQGQRWLSGYILRKSGPMSFMVKLCDGRVVRRHYNHLRKRIEEDAIETSSPTDDCDIISRPISRDNSPCEDAVDHEPNLPEMINAEPGKRYPSRVHYPPDRYEPT